MKKTTIRLILTFAFICGAQHLAAQAPTAAAPTPTQNAADVVSLFSSHYAQVGKGPEPQSWGGDSNVTTTTITGTSDDILESTGNSKVVFTSGWKGQTKGYIHMHVYSEQGGAFSFAIGASFSGANITLPNFNWPTLPAKQWTSITVPVVEFVKAGLDDAVNLQCLKFIGKGKYYVDNIYAYGAKEEYVEPANIPAAPIPTPSADKVKSVFSDSYVNSQKGVTPQTFGGIVAKIVPIVSDANNKVLRLTKLGTSLCTIDTWKISDMTHIHVDVYYTGGGEGSFSFGMNASNWSGGNIKELSGYTWPTMKENQWNSVEVPISLFADAGLNLNAITQIKFFGSGNYYIDNLYAHEDLSTVEPIAPPTTVPSFTLNASDVKSIYCEQFEDPGYQDSELGMTDVDSNGNLMFYGQNALQNREFVEIVPGNKTIRLTDWNDYPFKAHKNSSVMDISDMDYIHINAYLMSPLDITNKPATLTFYMHDKDGGKVDSPGNTASVAMVVGQWVSISIPLCHYEKHLDLTKAYVLRARVGGYGGMEAYIDNIFAYKGAPIAGSLVAADCEAVDPTEPIQDSSSGKLPPRTDAFLGVNLASASGGTVPGTLGTNYRYPKLEDLYYFNAKGVKLIRFPFRWKRIQSELGGPLVTQDINAMKEVVKEAERLGIWVMLDMHDFGTYSLNDTTFAVDGRYKVKNSNGYWGPWKTADGVTNRDLSADFADVWGKLANEFKGFTNIWGYDLMNEPIDTDINMLRDSYQRVIDKIRAVDTKSAIVFEGNNYASASQWASVSDALKDLTDPIGNNIIYQAHTYFDNNMSGTYDEEYAVEVTDFNVYKKRLDPFINWCKTNGKKGMLGEFGVPYNGAKFSDPKYMVLIDSVFSYLKQNQLTSTYWCAGAFYETNHITVQPDKDYATEKSTMLIMDKYIRNFHQGTSSIGEIESDNIQISISPNPVTDNLTINSQNSIETIRIFNMYGQTIYERKNVDSSEETLNLSDLAQGNYLISIELKNNLPVVSKFIKK